MNKKTYIALAAAILLSGCAATVIGAAGKGAYNAANDERSIGDQGNDLNTKMSVKTALTQKQFKNISRVNVYCFNSIVYLVGEVDKKDRKGIVETALTVPTVKEVKTKWFDPGTGSTIEDTAIETAISGNLVFTKHVSSTNISLEVYGGNVVIVGILSSQDEINRAIKAVKATDGVKSVTNFLTVYGQK